MAFAVAHVGHDLHGAPVEGLDRLDRLVELLLRAHRVADGLVVLAQVDGDDVGALLREPDRVAPPLAVRRSRDEGDLALDPSRHVGILSSCTRTGQLAPPGRPCRPVTHLTTPWGAPSRTAFSGSVRQLPDERVGEQPPAVGEDGAAGVVRRRVQQATGDGVGGPQPPGGESRVSGSPSRSRRPSITASSARSSSSSSSDPAAGLSPAATRAACAAGCLTFHQRSPPTWLCAPGPIPHQLAFAQYSSLCRQRAAAAGRPVGDLVPLEPGAAEGRVGLLVAVGEDVVVGHRQLAAGDPPRQPGALLDDQRVGADVVDRRGEDDVQRGGPVGVGLPRCAVDQVEVDVLEARRRAPPWRPRPPGRGCAGGRARRARARRRTACPG